MPAVYDFLTGTPIAVELKNERRRIRNEQIHKLQSLEDKLAVAILDLEEPPSCVRRVVEIARNLFKVAQVRYL